MWFVAKLPQMTGLFKAPSVFCLCKTESISLHSFANIQLGLEHGKRVMCVWRDSHSNSPQKSEFADWFTHFIARSEDHWLLFQGLGLGSQHPHGGSLPSRIPLSGDLLPSTGLHGYYTHVHKPTHFLSSSFSVSLSLSFFHLAQSIKW